MNDRIKQDFGEKIFELRKQLDIRETPAGHQKRFKEKLRRKGNYRPGRLRSLGVKAAAAVALIAAVFTGWWWNAGGISEPVMAFDPELAELEVYYTNLYYEEFEEISQYDLEEYEFARQLKHDLDQIEASNQNFKAMIMEQGKNEYLVEALIENYQMKLKILKKLKHLIVQTENHHETSQPI